MLNNRTRERKIEQMIGLKILVTKVRSSTMTKNATSNAD